MRAEVIAVDRVSGGVIVDFSDGTSAFYDVEFLHEHRTSKGNNLLPSENVQKKATKGRETPR